jgi:hypothetical protein
MCQGFLLPALFPAALFIPLAVAFVAAGRRGAGLAEV